MVVRAGFGMNYTVGSYATFATTMAHQPPFANEQTNQEIDANGAPTSACAQTDTCLTLAQGFPAPATVGNYCARSALPIAVRADVESRYPEDAAVGRCDEPRLQRIEGKPSGYRYGTARARDQPEYRSDEFDFSI